MQKFFKPKYRSWSTHCHKKSALHELTPRAHLKHSLSNLWIGERISKNLRMLCSSLWLANNLNVCWIDFRNDFGCERKTDLDRFQQAAFNQTTKKAYKSHQRKTILSLREKPRWQPGDLIDAIQMQGIIRFLSALSDAFHFFINDVLMQKRHIHLFSRI